MAIVSATFDTVEKTLSVTVDGNPVADVAEVCMMREMYQEPGEDPEFCCSVTTVSEDAANKTRVLTRLVAEQGGLGEADRRTPLEAAVASYFGRG